MARTRLIERREGLGMSQADVAELVRCDTGTLSRWERGVTTPRPNQRRRLAEALNLSMAQLDLAINDEALIGNGQQVAPGWLSIYVGYEQTASTMRQYEPTVIAGLLQTPAYAEAIIRSDIADRTEADIARLVSMRITRQAVLTRSPGPLDLHVVLDEVALRRVAGSRAVMAEQLEHLIAMAELPTVTVQVLPFAHGAHAIGFGAFLILGFPWPFELAYVENRASATYLEAPQEVEAHAVVFDHLAGLALSPAESVEFIRTIWETYL